MTSLLVMNYVPNQNLELIVHLKIQDMFRVRNGCGIRNMTLAGLKGSEVPDGLQTKRVTGGAFVALDPMMVPEIQVYGLQNNPSHVQNVQTFGEQCIGLRIDGDLHNGGNKSLLLMTYTNFTTRYWLPGVAVKVKQN